MKVIILAGGYGTRLSEFTETMPKPMVRIGGKPIIWHIMKTYAHFGHNNFYVALGYKAEVIKEFFLNYRTMNSDFSVDLGTGEVSYNQLDDIDWKVTLVDTGEDSMTGGRVKRMKPYINNETCLLTYGDGVSNIDLNQQIAFHKSHGKMVTVTAVHPSARFGELEIQGEQVTSFQEKPQTGQGWINGGYFIIEPEFFDLIKEDRTILERDPLQRVAQMGELMAFRHNGFWQCLDTKRDHDYLEKLWHAGKTPWKL
ncbi:glucose-1-phosphate cytidylyltransferase [bacterium]|nr:glucose-1-phosphate cytidylyltransferase [bacterium]